MGGGRGGGGVVQRQRTECEGVSKISGQGKHWSSIGDKKKGDPTARHFHNCCGRSFPLDGYKN